MAFRSSAKATSLTGGNLTATPSGVVANDYLTACLTADGTSGSFTAPSGWAQIANLDQTSAQPTGGGGQTTRIYSKVATGSDSFAFTNTFGTESVLICMAHSGRNTVSPTTFVQTTFQNSAVTDPVSEAATGGSSAAGDDLIAYYSQNLVSFSPPMSSAAATGTPGTFTQRQSGDGTNDFSTFASGHTFDNFSGGATGNITSVMTDSSGTHTTGWTAVVISAAASGGVSNQIWLVSQ